MKIENSRSISFNAKFFCEANGTNFSKKQNWIAKKVKEAVKNDTEFRSKKKTLEMQLDEKNLNIYLKESGNKNYLDMYLTDTRCGNTPKPQQLTSDRFCGKVNEDNLIYIPQYISDKLKKIFR